MAGQIRFCPNCGSTEVEPDTSNAAYVAEAGGNPNSWECNNCDYTGLMPEGSPQDRSESEEIDFEPGENYSRHDTGFGKGYYRYILYVLVPLVLALLIARII